MCVADGLAGWLVVCLSVCLFEARGEGKNWANCRVKGRVVTALQVQRTESGDKDFRPEEQGGYQSVQGKKMQKSKARALQRKSRQEAERERMRGAARAAGLRSTFSAA